MGSVSASLVPESAHPSVCNGIVMHASIGLTYMSGNPVTAQVGAIVETGCSLWSGNILITVYMVNSTTGSRSLDKSFTVASGADPISENIGSYPVGIYTMEFDASGDGYSTSATGQFSVIPPPCAYNAFFVWNSNDVAQSFVFQAKSTCYWDVQVTWNGGGFTQIVWGNATGLFQNPQTTTISMPQNPTPPYLTITVTDENHWINYNQCSSIAQAESPGGCGNYYYDNEYLSSYPAITDTPYKLVFDGLTVIGMVAILVLLARVRVSKREAAVRYEGDVVEP